jgi:hypothetical protein
MLDAILYGQDHNIYPEDEQPRSIGLALSEALCLITDCTMPPTGDYCEVHE